MRPVTGKWLRKETTMSRTLSATVTCILSVVVTAFVTAQDNLPPALQAMADTEREFAGTAKTKGIRDSFLEFFAQDSIAFNPEATSARERLLKQPSTPFSVNELLWEPRMGDVAASGEIGWLTGPSTFIDHSKPDAVPRYGNYLSVWRKQPDGRWRVFIDVGTGLKAEASFAPGFTRMPFGPKYSGKEGKSAAERSLSDADKSLNARIVADGAARAYADVVVQDTRLHRAGGQPSIGPQAISSWLENYAGGLTASSTAVESSAAGDLGYSYGKYEVKTPRAESGAYVRIWTRNAEGRWLVVADVTQPSAAK
jgi:ketosteroid isomerase-like protein